MSTYRAVHVVSKGKLELAEKPLLDPLAGHVRIRVEACGVCHSDAITVDGLLPIQYPRVPGHEAVGRSMPSARASKAGAPANASASAFSAAIAGIANTAATAIS
jgi:D-arabinose 1-dehydrogenase-like Zn-dependent alcohol dehydrogenase